MGLDKLVRVLLLHDPVNSNNWGGVQTITQTLQHALHALGFEVVALPWQQTQFGGLLSAARNSDILVAAHNFGPTYCGVALKTLTRKPLVSWVHGPLLDVLQVSKASWWKRRRLKHVYGYVDRFVCVSQTTEKSLLGFLSTSVGRISRTAVVLNGLAPLAYPEDSLVLNTPIHQTNLSIGYIGRLSEEKRPHFLLETMRCLPTEAQLCIVGDGDLRPALEDAGKDLMANGRLKFLGRQVSSCGLYVPFQVTMLTSQYEGCPMTALESLACGVPCVALPIPAMRELFAQDAPYLLAHDVTPQALAIAVLNLEQIPLEQVQADMARIVTKYSLLNFANSWKSTLLDLVHASK